MKKFILSVVAIASLATVANAQKLSWGPEVGLNMSSITFDPSIGTVSSKTGFKVGGVAEFSLLGMIAIQPGVFFSQMGTKLDAGTGVETVNINYIQIPVNVFYKLGIGPVKILLGAGPYFGYALSGKNETTGADLKFGSDATTDDFKSTDFGIGFHGGVQLPMGLQAKIGYNLGLMNTSPLSTISAKNNNIGISIAWLFGGM